MSKGSYEKLIKLEVFKTHPLTYKGIFHISMLQYCCTYLVHRLKSQHTTLIEANSISILHFCDTIKIACVFQSILLLKYWLFYLYIHHFYNILSNSNTSSISELIERVMLKKSLFCLHKIVLLYYLCNSLHIL